MSSLMSRMLAARTPSTGGSETASSNPDPKRPGRTKRTLIESACQQCRRRKSRCDGIRPSCTRCQALRTECVYEAEEGESRWSVLRRRNQMLENERSDVRELFDYLQTRPDFEAQDMLNRIRVGGYDEIFNMLQQLRHGGQAPCTQPTCPPLLQRPPSAAGENRLPPIQTMFAVASNSGSASSVNVSLNQNNAIMAESFSNVHIFDIRANPSSKPPWA